MNKDRLDAVMFALLDAVGNMDSGVQIEIRDLINCNLGKDYAQITREDLLDVHERLSSMYDMAKLKRSS